MSKSTELELVEGSQTKKAGSSEQGLGTLLLLIKSTSRGIPPSSRFIGQEFPKTLSYLEGFLAPNKRLGLKLL